MTVICLFSYFQQPLDVYCTFIPQLLFLICIFFYLCIMIFYKWTTFGAAAIRPMAVDPYGYPGSHCAPSLLIGLISMFMFKSRPEGFHDESKIDPLTKEPIVMPTCYLNAFYRGQVRVLAILKRGLGITELLRRWAWRTSLSLSQSCACQCCWQASRRYCTCDNARCSYLEDQS